MANLDLERASTLLNIIEKCADHGNQLNHLSAAARAELGKINDSLKPKPALVPTPSVRSKGLAAVEKELEAAGEGDAKPSVYPGDSETATIADRRI